jgi:phosphatidylglycerol:prolipoprotein diacylglycerol transferase
MDGFAPVNAAFDLHFGYALMVLLGIGLTMAFPTTKHFEDARDKRRYYTMQAITAVCAVLGAKLAVVLGDALWPLHEFHGWSSLLTSGRSIVGALLFGFLGVEAAKPLLNYDIPPNDRFAIILPFSLGLGRIGCLMVGCCRGLPYDGPLAITYSDGIPRHPAQVYEMVFHWAMGFLLIALWRRQILFGRLFALYLASYGVFRFFSEYLRETPKAYGGLSAYQILSVAMIVAGGVALVARSLHQPPTWEKWKWAARRAQ